MRRSLALLLRALLRVDLGDQSLDALVAALGAFFEALDQLGCARRVAARCAKRRCCLLKTRLQAKEHLREVFEVEGATSRPILVGSYGLRDVEPELVIAEGGIKEPGER